MRHLGLELTFAWRRFLASRGSTATTVLVLALGTGANVAVFGVLDPLLLRPLPVRAPGELALVHSVGTLGTSDVAEPATFEIDRGRRDLFTDVAWDEGTLDQRVTLDGTSSSARADTVSANYFSLLGLSAATGRVSLTPADDRVSPRVVLDYRYWQRQFHEDASAVGRTVTVGNQPATILGVAPPDFFGLTVGDRADMYVLGGPTVPNWIRIIGRLRSDTSVAAAEAGLTVGFSTTAGRSLPDVERLQHMAKPVVTPIASGLSDVREPLVRPAWALMAMVALLMAIAASNAATVLVARQASRRAETAIQIALGAGSFGVVRGAVLDGLLVTIAGTIAGLAVGLAGSAGLARALTATYGVSVTATFSIRIFVFVLFGVAATVLIAGAVPAIAATRVDVIDGLRWFAGSVSPTRRQRRLTRAFVAAQVGSSVTLVATAALFVHSLANLEGANPGFDKNRIAVVTLASVGRGSSEPSPAAIEAIDQITSALGATPGVDALALSNLAPFSGDTIGINVTTDVAGSTAPARTVHAFFSAVTPTYFDTLGIPVEVGRTFAWTDDTPDQPSIVLNGALARALFGGSNPLGHRVRFVEGHRPPMTVVGIVAVSRYFDLREAPTSFAYTLRPRVPNPPAPRTTLLIRGPLGAVDSLDTTIRRVAGPYASAVSVGAVTTLQTMVERSLRVDRAVAWLCSVVSALALAVVAIGLYGVLAVDVVRRRREIGLRMALGARTGDVVALMARAGGGLIGVGLVLGLIGATIAHALVASQLFSVPRLDAITVAAVVMTTIGVAAVAFAAPVRRAISVDPAVVLRRE